MASEPQEHQTSPEKALPATAGAAIGEWALANARQMLMAFWEKDFARYNQKLEEILRYCPDYFEPDFYKPEHQGQDVAVRHMGELKAISGLEVKIQSWPLERPGRDSLLLLLELIRMDRNAFPYSRFKAFRRRIHGYLQSHPRFDELTILEVYACHRGRDHRQGLRLLEPLLQARPDDSLRYYLKAQLLIDGRRRKDAEVWLDQALERFPEHGLLHGARALLLMETRRFAEALPALLQAHQLRSGQVEVMLSIHQAMRMQVLWYRQLEGWKYGLPLWLRFSLDMLLWPLDAVAYLFCDRILARDPEKVQMLNQLGLISRSVLRQARKRDILLRCLAFGVIYYGLMGLCLMLIWQGLARLLPI